MSQTHRARVLALYRDIIRAARLMPTKNRELYVKAKARLEFRRGSAVTSPAEVDELLAFAELSLDNINAQAAALTRIARDPASFFPSVK